MDTPSPLPGVPTAREARQRADLEWSARAQAHRARCLRLLHEAIDCGRHQAVLPHPLPADLERELLAKGYTFGPPYDSAWQESSVQVRW